MRWSSASITLRRSLRRIAGFDEHGCELGRLLHRLRERAEVGADLVEVALLRADARRSPWRSDGPDISDASLAAPVPTFDDERADELVLIVGSHLLAQQLLGRAGRGGGDFLVSCARASSISAAMRCSASRFICAACAAAASRMRFLSASASARMPSTSFLTSASTSLMRASYSASFSAACSRSLAASSSAVLI